MKQKDRKYLRKTNCHTKLTKELDEGSMLDILTSAK